MSETYISSSGEFKQFVDGDLVNDFNYNTEYDGNILDAALSINDQSYYTKLDNEDLMQLLSYPKDHDGLIIRLQDEFPLPKSRHRKTKANKRKGKKNTKKK